MEPKIVHIISHLKVGGAQRLLLDLVKNIPNSKVLALAGGAMAEDFPEVEVIRTSNKLFPKKIKDIKKYLEKEEANIIHTHLWHADFMGGTAAAQMHLPWIATEHSINWGVEGKLKHSAKKQFIKKADMLVAISNQVKQYLIKDFNIPKEKIFTIYNGVDTNIFKFTDFPDNERPVIACVGRLDHIKGQDLLLRALAGIESEYKCLIVGDGGEKKKLEAQAIEFGIRKKVEFLGSRKDVADIFGKADFSVVPSRQEGLGLAAIESSLVGRPVIGFNVGGLGEVIQDGRTGFLVPAESVGAMQEKIEILINDQTMRREMGETAYAYAKEKFSLQKMIASYKELYAHIANQ
ncbi:glycosyltransferase family 4 protein [Patescibacteria group bacterium]|nr:glycosyltransferase family 4 protein [Patescibacteria group bacterium]MBU1673286.1 glycosyltransferase family 4 protein [Patescibacteria group bacterium]MBU1963339.1 glycosyltransferase family 4 protein [Patescibacteria group bacterium]